MRRLFYQLAALMGWYNAASKGPAALAKRVVRVQAYKGTARIINRLLK